MNCYGLENKLLISCKKDNKPFANTAFEIQYQLNLQIYDWIFQIYIYLQNDTCYKGKEDYIWEFN